MGSKTSPRRFGDRTIQAIYTSFLDVDNNDLDFSGREVEAFCKSLQQELLHVKKLVDSSDVCIHSV